MKSIILAIVAVAAASTSAFAADRLVKSPPMAAPADSWTGGYVGASVGYGWDRTSVEHVLTNCNDPMFFFLAGCGGFRVPPPPISFGGKGVLAGLQWGYNYQFGAGLIGVEADYSWSRLNGSGTSPIFSDALLVAGNIFSTQNLDGFGTIRGRLGWLPTQQWLLYVTGGLAFGHANREVTLQLPRRVGASGVGFGFLCGAGLPCFLGNQKQSTVGWTVGGGTEWAISTNVTVKAEYLYASLAGTAMTAIALDGFGQAPSSFRTIYDRPNLHVARIGINYHFNAP